MHQMRMLLDAGVRGGLVLAAAAALLGACGGGPSGEDLGSAEDEGEVELGKSQQALCQNDGGVNGVLAALAVSSANEMRRWLPTRDFQWNNSTWMLELSSWAFSRCRDAAPGCPNTQALLAMQQPSASGNVTFPGNVKLD